MPPPEQGFFTLSSNHRAESCKPFACMVPTQRSPLCVRFAGSGFEFECNVFPLKEQLDLHFYPGPASLTFSTPFLCMQRTDLLKKECFFPREKVFASATQGCILTSLIWNFTKIFICMRRGHNSIRPYWGIILNLHLLQPLWGKGWINVIHLTKQIEFKCPFPQKRVKCIHFKYQQ